MVEFNVIMVFMKRTFLLSVFLFSITMFSFSQGNETNIVLDGHYQGKNLYIQNPFSGSGVGFCVIAVYVNNDVTTDQVNSSAFEIDFSNTDLKPGDPVSVKILHKLDCLPKVLNPEVLRPKSTFEEISIAIEDNQVFKWSTAKEQGELTYIIEQYRWNKWVKVGEVDGKGKIDANSYKFNVGSHIHSGENKFRAKQVDYTGRPRFTKSVTCINSDQMAVSIPNPKMKNTLDFSSETLYEIYDTYGNLVKKGFGQSISVENLNKGLFYVNYDSKTGEVVNKK